MKHFVPLSRRQEEKEEKNHNIKKHLKHIRENEKNSLFDTTRKSSRRQEEKCALKGKRKEFINSRFYQSFFFSVQRSLIARKRKTTCHNSAKGEQWTWMFSHDLWKLRSLTLSIWGFHFLLGVEEFAEGKNCFSWHCHEFWDWKFLHPKRIDWSLISDWGIGMTTFCNQLNTCSLLLFLSYESFPSFRLDSFAFFLFLTVLLLFFLKVLLLFFMKVLLLFFLKAQLLVHDSFASFLLKSSAPCSWQFTSFPSKFCFFSFWKLSSFFMTVLFLFHESLASFYSKFSFLWMLTTSIIFLKLHIFISAQLAIHHEAVFLLKHWQLFTINQPICENSTASPPHEWE